MSIRSFTYTETTNQMTKNREYLSSCTIVTVMPPAYEGDSASITSITTGKRYNDGRNSTETIELKNFKVSQQKDRLFLIDDGVICKVEGDRIVEPVRPHLEKISVSLLRRALDRFNEVNHVPSAGTEEETISPSDEEVTEPVARSRGRPRIYTHDEKKSKHREQALKSYYRRKALKEHLREPVNGDEVSFPFMANSKVLGDFYEEVTFKRTNGVYRKKQE